MNRKKGMAGVGTSNYREIWHPVETLEAITGTARILFIQLMTLCFS